MAIPADPQNEFRSGDLDNNLLRKVLDRMKTVMKAIDTVTPTVVIEPGNVQIGSVVIKDGDGLNIADVEVSDPPVGDAGLVVRNIPSGTQTIAGTVAVSSMPAVSGTVAVSNLPATQPVSGTVAVSNFPASTAVSNFPATQPVSGSVSVSNFPATQPVSGSVSVANFPATQPVSGSVTVSGAVSVSNFPATQPVSGTVSVANFPAVQTTVNEFSLTNPEVEIARRGLLGTKAALEFHIMGRRAGFNSTSVLQDVAEFLATSIDAMPELTGAENLEVVSSSASDTAAGTGARTVRVTYIDTGGSLVTSADITLNGVTAVALAFKSLQILWMEVTTVGSNTVAVGNVLLRIAGAGATHEQITAGGNRSLSSHFMVPTGYTGYLTQWSTNAIGGATQDARLRATVRSGDRSLGTAYVFQDTQFQSAGGVSDTLPWLVCPALSKIKVSTISSNAPVANRIDADYTIILVAN